MKSRIAGTLNYAVAALALLFGVIYLTRSSFMHYHSKAISLEWEEVEPATRILILALMRAVAGGFLAVAILISFLQYKFSTMQTSWIPFLIFIVGTTVLIGSFYATALVRINTPGNPPLYLVVIAEAFLIIAYLLSKGRSTS